ncbi:hypothetical protein LTR12_010993 [Friedmanniomyces endolithicus]|nr:hypothetical protein LTR12_010993 [Friedmanniomyces endolithicus]
MLRTLFRKVLSIAPPPPPTMSVASGGSGRSVDAAIEFAAEFAAGAQELCAAFEMSPETRRKVRKDFAVRADEAHADEDTHGARPPTTLSTPNRIRPAEWPINTPMTPTPPVPKKRGRPPGSKNRPKPINHNPDRGTSSAPPEDEEAAQFRTDYAKHTKAQQHIPNLTERTAGLTTRERWEREKPALEAKRTIDQDRLRRTGDLKVAFPDNNVCICNFNASKAENREVAGYLNLASTKELEEVVLGNAVVAGHLMKLHESHDSNVHFGMTCRTKGGQKISIKTTDLFRYLAQGDVFSQAAVDTDAEPVDANYPRDDKSFKRVYLLFLRAAKQCIRALPTVFTGSFPGCPSQAYFDCQAEDLHRFMSLWFWYTKTRRKSTKGKDADTIEGTQKIFPTLPMFCHPDQVLMNTEEQAARTRRALDSLLRQDLSEYEFLRAIKIGQARGDVDITDESDRHRFGAVHIRKDIPLMEPEQRIALMECIGSRVSVLHEDPSKTSKFFTVDLRTLDSSRTQQSHHANLLAGLGDEEPEPAEVDEADVDARAVFMKMQHQLNYRSAREPTWEDCVRELGLDVVDEPSQLTNQPFKVFFRGIELLPWQAAAALFIFRRITSDIRFCINADDTGLGKTISILVAVVRWSEFVEERRADWQAQYERRLADARVAWQDRNIDGEVDEAALREHLDVVDLGPEPIHRPVLVVFPLSGTGAWTRDTLRFADAALGHNICVRRFYGVRGKHPRAIEQDNQIHDAERLRAVCEALDTRDPCTSRTIVMATYFTFHSRTLCDANGTLLSSRSTRFGARGPTTPPSSNPTTAPDSTGTAEQDGDDDAEGDERPGVVRPELEQAESAPGEGVESGEGDAAPWEEEMEEADEATVNAYAAELTQNVTRFQLNIPHDLFGFRVMDEGHRMKDPESLQARALNLLSCPAVVSTATPAVPTARDLAGLLHIAWNLVDPRYRRVPEQPNYASFVENFARFEQDYDLDLLKVPREVWNIYIAAINPAIFREIVTLTAAKDPHITASILPLPMSLLSLRRVVGQTITAHQGLQIQVGKDIPPYHIVHVELRAGDFEDGMYRGIHERVMAGAEVRAVPSKGGSAKASNPKRRTLQQTTMNRLLDTFQRRTADEEGRSIKSMQKQGLDSFDVLFRHTRDMIGVLPPTDRIGMAVYICAPSVKCSFMVRELLAIVVRKGQKMIVWAHWPGTLWLCELICSILQIRYMSIRAGVPSAKRAQAETAFNGNPDMMVLICSSRSAAESLNLQYGGWHQLVIDLVAIPTLMQMVGRSFRYGQLYEQIIKVLMVDETYDQQIQAINMSHYRGLVAATAHPDFEHDVTAVFDGFGSELLAQSQQRDETGELVRLKAKTRSAYLDGLIRSLLGLRSERHTWKETLGMDVTAKNMLPSERMFRLATGGDVARLMVKQIDETAERAREDRVSAAADTPRMSAVHPARVTTFANTLCLRPEIPLHVSDERIASELLKATEALVSDEIFRLHGIGTLDALAEAQDWVADAKHVHRAVELYRQEQTLAQSAVDAGSSDFEAHKGRQTLEEGESSALPLRGIPPWRPVTPPSGDHPRKSAHTPPSPPTPGTRGRKKQRVSDEVQALGEVVDKGKGGGADGKDDREVGEEQIGDGIRRLGEGVDEGKGEDEGAGEGERDEEGEHDEEGEKGEGEKGEEGESDEEGGDAEEGENHEDGQYDEHDEADQEESGGGSEEGGDENGEVTVVIPESDDDRRPPLTADVSQTTDINVEMEPALSDADPPASSLPADPRGSRLAILRNFRNVEEVRRFCMAEFHEQAEGKRRDEVLASVADVWLERERDPMRAPLRIDWAKYQAVYKGPMPRD